MDNFRDTSDEDGDTEEPKVERRRRRANREWVKKAEYESNEEAVAAIDDRKWKKSSSKNCTDVKFHFRDVFSQIFIMLFIIHRGDIDFSLYSFFLSFILFFFPFGIIFILNMIFCHAIYSSSHTEPLFIYCP